MSGEQEHPERLCGALRSAHEKLCIAQTDVPDDVHRAALGEALHTIERVGVFWCSDWSRYTEPMTGLDYSAQFGEEEDD